MAAADRGLLRNRAFLAIWGAQILSQVASNAVTSALIILVAEITHSNTSSSVLILLAAGGTGVALRDVSFAVRAGECLGILYLRGDLVQFELFQFVFEAEAELRAIESARSDPASADARKRRVPWLMM